MIKMCWYGYFWLLSCCFGYGFYGMQTIALLSFLFGVSAIFVTNLSLRYNTFSKGRKFAELDNTRLVNYVCRGFYELLLSDTC